jgi:hypothetical protein
MGRWSAATLRKRSSHNAKRLTSERLDSILGITAHNRVEILLDFLFGVGLQPTTTHFACRILVRVVGGDGFEPPTPAL